MTHPQDPTHRLTGPLRATRRALQMLTTFASHGAFEATCRLLLGPDLKRCLWITHAGAQSMLAPMGIVMHVHGKPPHGEHGALLVSNHCSYADIVLIAANCATTFLAKKEVSRWPIIGQAATAVGTVYVDRSSPESRRASRARIHQRIHHGISITVFPEGTTTPGPSTLDFRPGTFATAVDAGVPVVPVAIAYHDPRDAWIGDDGFVGHFMSRFSRPRVRVSISFGPPLQDDDVEALRLAAQTWVRDELTRLHRALDTPYDLINPQDRVGALPG